LDAGERMRALLHDASEYVVGDMISPFKNAIGVDYRSIEDRLQQAIHIRFGLSPETPVALKKLIKRADRQAAWLEATSIAGFAKAEANRLWGKPPSVTLEGPFDPTPHPPERAKARMIARHASLMAALSR
jgi:5'-deoxynucleotidase YfbR-like HD superfamily hydrolase